MAIRSIRLKVTLVTCALIAAVVVAYGAASYQAVRESAEISTRERLSGLAQELATNLGGAVTRMKEQITAIASDPAVSEFLRDPGAADRVAAINALRTGSQGAAPSNLPTELRDAEGRRLLDTGQPLPTDASLTHTEIRGLIGSQERAAIAPLRTFGDTIMWASLAMVRNGGDTAGYVVRWHTLSTPPASMRLISDMVGADARVYLLNARGDLWSDLNQVVPPLAIDPVELAAGAVRLRTELRDIMVVGVAVPGAPWMVAVELPYQEVLSAPRQVMGDLALIGLLLMSAAALIAWVLSGRVTRAVVELADAASAVSGGDYSRRAAVDGEDELGTLGRAFNSMTDSISTTREQLEDKVQELAASEEQTRRTREQLEYVITSSSAILYRARFEESVDAFDWISSNVERMLGYPVEQALRPGWWILALHPDDREEAAAALEELEDEGESTRSYRLMHSDGDYRWIRDERRMLGDGDSAGREIVGFLVDITENRRLELARVEAEAASWAKNEFLSRMSHELRTPLNAVLGFAQLLELDVQDEEQRESVDQILRAGRHLLALVDEVLDIARIEAGKMSLSVEPVAVRTVVYESTDLMRVAASEQGIEIIRMDIVDGAGPYVWADQQRLKQVLLNLISNAIKYNRSNGSVTISCEQLAGDRTRISVADTGMGLTEQQLERLFTPFDRLGAEGQATEGTGLGLALSRGLMEAMNGRIGVESTPGAGSRFWLELPTAPATSLPTTLEESSHTLDSPRSVGETSHTVLFVEDNIANVRLMERVFRRRPAVRLLTAMQASEGLELARVHSPDLILLDLNLPDSTGDQLLLRLRGDSALQHIPVVMVSGDATPARVERLLSLGAQDYLTKPFDIRALLQTVDSYLRREGSPPARHRS